MGQQLREDMVRKIMDSYGNDPTQLVAILLDIQNASGRNYVDMQWAKLVSRLMGIPLSKVFDILTFYSMFSITPRGKYLIEICHSTPCQFCGTKDVVGWFEAAAEIKIGQTSTDGKITLVRTNCVGHCEIGPVVKIGDDVFGNLDEEKAKTLVKRCREGKLNEVFPCQT